MFKYLCAYFAIIISVQGQKFIPIDETTNEFISVVNYDLFLNKDKVYNGLTSIDSITRLPNVVFDSIHFYKSTFKDLGLKKSDLTEVVMLTKLVYDLDEVVVSSKSMDVIGEQNRFIKSHSFPITPELSDGILFKNNQLSNFLIKKVHFYVEKLGYTTTYKIKFYSVEEVTWSSGRQTLQFNELIAETPLLTIESGKKGKIEVDLESLGINLPELEHDLFVCIELGSHYNVEGEKIEPPLKQRTKLKYQISNLTNYYAKTTDAYSNKASLELYNINLQIKYDFAFHLFKKPHKSIFVAPALVLNGIKQ